MTVAVRLTAFVVVLVLCFGAAYVLGTAVGPLDEPERPPAAEDDDGPRGPTTTSHGTEHGG